MKYIQLLFILLISFQTPLKAQKLSKEFGKVGKDDIELAVYPEDKSAEAIVLFDIGKSYFIRPESSFEVIFERTTRIKIFTNAGLQWAEVEIPFYQEGGIYEEVYDIEGCTYNFEDGRLNKTGLNPSNCHDEKINEYWNVKKFAMPNVKEGSIIEYKYKIRSQYTFNLRDWEFQWKIPTVYSEYEVKMIPFYEYSWLLQGANGFDSQTSYVDKGIARRLGAIEYQDMFHQYVMKDVPAFNDEEFIASINDYIIKLDFQLARINYPSGASVDVLTTWPDLKKELIKHTDFGKYVEKSKKLGSKLFDMDSMLTQSPRERFDKIVKHVKANYNWNNINSKYASKSPANFMKDKYGNAADINLFLIGLLNAVEIEAYPVLISTRKNGKIKYDYPYSHFFNYVIISAIIDGQKILTDATEVLSASDRIPSRCINDKGLIIDQKKEEIEWVDLQCLIPSEKHTDLSIDILNSDLNATIETSFSEYDALYYRNTYGEDRDKIKERLNEDGYSVMEPSLIVLNQYNIKKPYILKYSITDKIEEIQDKIYLSPFLNDPITDNPLKQTKRTYPIDMNYPCKRTYNSTIQIPDGYKVDFLPTNHKINNDLFELEYSVTSDVDMVHISFYYYFKNAVYSAKDYGKLKYYFNEIVKRGNEKVVFSKISETN